ncbi:MAG: transglutaminase family protein, partial [Alphaproteobacteria bacterium]|nr:transglutaminase family protein [Alphaproteobacteria bacterium]
RDHFVNWQQDPQGNWLARLVFPEKVQEFVVDVDLLADLSVINPFDFFLEPAAETFPFAYAPELDHELKPFLLCEAAGPLLNAYMASIPTGKPFPTTDFLVALNQRLKEEIRYTIRLEPGVRTPEQTLALKSGSCRDSAWLLVQVLRRLGLAARFVSGYLIQLVADEKPLEGPAGPASDFTDLHAWAEVYLPGAGWIGLDPTSGLLTGEGHIPLAASPDPTSAAPITGLVGDCKVEFDHHMEILRVLETPRVTKPYSEDQWRSILTLGERVDERLMVGDVRLTQGGEPTFVSAVDMDGDEWNLTADGPTKRAHADDLIRRLRARFAPGCLVTFGQGKWYPGESLPRWAFSLMWREDDEPVWADDGLIARAGSDHASTIASAEVFTTHLAEALGVAPTFAQPTYEDPVHYLMKEMALPVNVDPIDNRLTDPEERARLARIFRRGLGNPVGLVLPLQPWQSQDGHRWVSGPWPTRTGRLIAKPGDSPLGFRLPLDSLPWLDEDDTPRLVERDPFEPRPALARHQHTMTRRVPGRRDPPKAVLVHQRSGAGKDTPRETDHGLESDIVRTALCVEPRDGCLNLFLPPLETAEQYLDLVAAIESTARALKMPVRIEGYPPPSDPRLRTVKVTPDPGVIEVNVQPAANWRQLVAITEGLYEDARLTRLGTEKFMMDGRHVGTGGGNHMVLG